MIRAALSSRPDVARPPSGDWTEFMARLDRAVARERSPQPVVKFRPILAKRTTYVPYLAMAALLVLVTMSVVYVNHRRSTAPEFTTTALPVRTLSPPQPTRQPERSADAAFAALSEQHFERSKLVVLGLAAKNAHDASAADWAYERQLASSLLKDTRLYRLAAEERGMTSLARIMSDLELVLLQASLADEQDAATLERLQGLIRKRDLVTKMEAVNTAGL
jgi:hypothetical protein